MKRPITLFIILFTCLAVLAALRTSLTAAANLDHVASTTILYDGYLGTTPDQQGFDLVGFPLASQVISGDLTVLDTTANDGYQAGYLAEAAQLPILNRSTGFTLVFTVALPAESHTKQDRAGFSLLALADDRGGALTVQGIELGFWLDQVWAQEDDTQGGTLFTRAESAAYDTRPLRRYQLAFTNDNYTLWAGGSPLLTGRLRDYSNFAGTVDPYETPNLLFLGDNTTSAAAELHLAGVTLQTLDGLSHLYLPLIRHP